LTTSDARFAGRKMSERAPSTGDAAQIRLIAEQVAEAVVPCGREQVNL
jgi:hypothetical protein